MTLNLELSPDLAEKLNVEVNRRGIPAEAVAIGALDDHLSRLIGDPARPRPAPGSPVAKVVSDEEWEAAFADIEQLTADLPPANIPDEMLRRKHLYEIDPSVVRPISSFVSPGLDWKQRLTAAQKACEQLLRDAPIIPLEALRRENLYADDGL